MQKRKQNHKSNKKFEQKKSKIMKNMKIEYYFEINKDQNNKKRPHVSNKIGETNDEIDIDCLVQLLQPGHPRILVKENFIDEDEHNEDDDRFRFITEEYDAYELYFSDNLDYPFVSIAMDCNAILNIDRSRLTAQNLFDIIDFTNFGIR